MEVDEGVVMLMTRVCVCVDGGGGVGEGGRDFIRWGICILRQAV